jgi:hypothetical protein
VSAWLEATQIAGFSEAESNKLFGKQDEMLVRDLRIHLRPPVQARNAFTTRHAELMSQL